MIRYVLCFLLLPVAAYAGFLTVGSGGGGAGGAGLDPPTGGDGGTIIVNETFDSGDWGEYWSENWCNFAYSCQVVSDPGGGGGYSFREEFRPENCTDRPTMGDQLRGPEIVQDEFWLGVRVYFSSTTWPYALYPFSILSTHGQPDDVGVCDAWRSGPFAVWYGGYTTGQEGKLRVTYRQQATECPNNDVYDVDVDTYSGQVTLDAWNSLVAHVEWDKTGTSGTLEFWLNGTKVVDEVGTIGIGFNDSQNPYLKFGQYNWECNTPDDMTVIGYHDDITISVGAGANFCDVNPTGGTLPNGVSCD